MKRYNKFSLLLITLSLSFLSLILFSFGSGGGSTGGGGGSSDAADNKTPSATNGEPSGEGQKGAEDNSGNYDNGDVKTAVCGSQLANFDASWVKITDATGLSAIT